MSTLALDLGTHTGFAIGFDTVGSVVSGSWDFSTKRHEDAGRRFTRFRDALADVVKAYGVTVIYYEEVRRHASTSAAHIYGGFVAMLKSFCVDNGVGYESVPVGQIKKSWTGKGNAKKDAMIDEARRRGHEPADDNEADALAILAMKHKGA